MKITIDTVILSMIAVIWCVVAVAIIAQKIADWWYDYSIRRELDKIIKKELRQSRREFRR